MNILFWSETYPPVIGGAELWGSRFVDALTTRGHHVAVVSRKEPGGDAERNEAAAAAPIHRFPFWESLTRRDSALSFATREIIARLKQTFRPDVVHLSSLGPSFFYHLVTQRAWCTPTLLTLHSSLRRRPSPGTFVHRVIGEADWVVGVSHAVLREACELVPAASARSSVIYHGVELRPATGESPSVDPPILVCLGRLVRDKGFDVAIAAMSQLRRLVPAVRLVVGGDGPEAAALQERVRELGLGDRVVFAGPVAPGDVPAFLTRASVVVMPSRAEGFGLVALEAAAVGRPVVAARVGGLPEVIESEKTGLLVEPDQPAALAQAVFRLLSDPARLRGMGDAARARAREIFPWSACVDRYLAHYASIQAARHTSIQAG
jgi:glycogen(starch) synthase